MISFKSWRNLAIASALAVSPLIGFSAVQSAHAAGCSGTGCDGRDPIQAGCASDAYTAISDYIYNSVGNAVARVDLRYSPSCGTNWARTVSLIGPQHIDAVVTRNDIALHYDEYLYNVTNVYTDMIYAPSPICAQAGGEIELGGTYYDDAGVQAC